MSTLVEDLLELQSHLQAVALIEGDVVTCDDAARLMAANVLITKICNAPKPTGPDAPGELRIS
jgi:hypothetical protein